MKFVAIVLTLLALCAGASAEEKPDRKLAVEFLKAAQYEQAIDASMASYQQQLFNRIPPKDRAIFDRLMRETMGWDATKDQLADLVISTYSKAEVDAYLAFSNTAIGKSFNAKGVVFSEKFAAVLSNNMQKFIEQNLTPLAISDATPRAAN